MTDRWRLLAVDDNPIVRTGLLVTLNSMPEVEVVREASDGATALAICATERIDLVLLDVRMPNMGGIEFLAKHTGPPVLMLTHSDEPHIVREAMELGACGYVLHGSLALPELHERIRQAVKGIRVEPVELAHDNTMGLTEREVEIMEHLAAGSTNAQIATSLFLSEKTVKNHLARIYPKLGVSGRSAAVAAWLGRND